MITLDEDTELAPLRLWLAQRSLLVQRVLLTGSRTWSRARLLRMALQLLPETATLVHGGARGADSMGDQVWSLWLKRPVEVHALPDRWWLSGASIPLERDRQMVRAGADVCLAFIRAHSGGATKTAAWAEQAGIPTFRYRQE